LNAPDVNVANTPNVNVVNTPAAPVITRNAAEPAFQPIQLWDFATVQQGETNHDLTFHFTVPAGKELVIEYVNAEAFSFTNPGQAIGSFLLKTGCCVNSPADAIPNAHRFAPVSYDAGDGSPAFLMGQQVRFYADPGTQVVFSSVRTGGAQGSYKVYAVVTGYLVDLP
jgi:hypothetical protein